MNKVVVTGGCGFIGSHFIRYLLANDRVTELVNIDKLTYAGNPDNVADVADDPRYRFVKADICDADQLGDWLKGADAIVNFAAETHVDRSLMDSTSFLRTDVFGTLALLEAVRKHGIGRFLQVSTDEVYGSLASGSSATPDFPLSPSSPYAASKASADLLALAFVKTHQVPVIITRCTNNYGSFQYPEKLIPLFITNAIGEKPLPLYGDGSNVRDWIHVDDHVRGVALCLEKGEDGAVYHFGGGAEVRNRDVADAIVERLGVSSALIQSVTDRPGHDQRYSLDCSATERDLGWKAAVSFREGLASTVEWYQEHSEWWERLKGAKGFQSYYEEQYRS